MVKKSKKAFTLVEMIIVMGVIAILSAVLIPAFSGLVKNSRVSKATQTARNTFTAFYSETIDTIKTSDTVFLYQNTVIRVISGGQYYYFLVKTIDFDVVYMGNNPSDVQFVEVENEKGEKPYILPRVVHSMQDIIDEQSVDLGASSDGNNYNYFLDMYETRERYNTVSSTVYVTTELKNSGKFAVKD